MEQQINPDSRQWWRPVDVPDAHSLCCRIGPLTLTLYRGGGEWRIAWRYYDERSAAADVRMSLVPGLREPDSAASAGGIERYVFGRNSGRIRLRPRLLDRPVVIRPRQPVFLPSGEETTLYLSSPLCLCIEAGDAGVTLREIQMVRLPDTWFGPSTREGELCYSGRTHARHSLGEVPERPHRAVTPVRIRNHAVTALPLDRISLPVPALSIYGDGAGNLRTQEVSLVRSFDTDMAALRIEAGRPGHGRDAELLSGPRRELERGGLVRAFSVLFGH